MLGKTLAATLLLSATAASADLKTAAFGVNAMPFTAGKSTLMATGQDRLFNRPTVELAGTYMTTPDGCSYSMAQAPGYAPRWYLIMNPHHIGMPPAHSGCAGVISG